MHASEEKDDSPLLDADISRLIKLSREVGYKKQGNIPQRNLLDFKPLSIDKIVAEVDSKASKADAPIESEDEKKLIVSNFEAKDVDTQREKKDSKTETSSNDDKIEGTQQEDITERVEENSGGKIVETPDEGMQNLDDKEVETPDEGMQNLDDKEVLKQNVMTPSNNDDAIEVARKEGIEIGKKMAFSKMETDHKRNVDALTTLIKNIKSKEVIDKSELMNSIIKVIISLASERAGLEIDKAPEILKDKIVAFVDEIEHASNKVIVNLNPKDAELIKKITSEPLFEENIEFKENSELFRGDFILQMGTIDMGNLISKQLFISEPEIEETNKLPSKQDEYPPIEETKELNELAETSSDQQENQTGVEENGK